MTEDSISVIIPTFNRHSTIMNAVRSASDELQVGDEIIIVDDASAPPISIDVTNVGKLPLQLVRSETNLGAAGARNLGLAHARNKFVAFLDSDDRWLPGKLHTQRQLLKAGDECLVAIGCGWRETVNNQPIRSRMPVASRERADFFAGCWFAPGSTLLVSAEAFRRVGGFDENLQRLEDYEWFLRFALAGGRLVIAEVLGAEIAHGTNARPLAVDAAVELISMKFATLQQLEKHERQSALAYLNLERARAYLNAGMWGRAALMLGRSFYHCPRTRIPLRNWWRHERLCRFIECQ
ncbi:glycosyltransferase family 2 protein [Mesorhizobium sp. RP14(2022)]|uniref:Glycosyltransferase family 2 protein n=1 Tax=Mesorhizobium liriopis TaxID=2953882 RepID=A0ABT1C5P9_9HYPH|nr:glycosyltransferase family A protein [Mesorhizobium liriopis]MCO6050157.1 glycosyltransferase family 2 protein [Mesorhizobium liriopis]